MNSNVKLSKPKRARPRLAELEKITHDQSLVVWWYGSIQKNHRAKSVPLVAVFFRKIDDLGNLGGFIQHPLALTHLGLLRVGTIWKEGYCTAEIEFDEDVFNVNFSKIGWTFVSPSTSDGLIPESDYQLKYQNDKNWLVKLELSHGRSAIIPCVEFFSRLYGRSQEIKRVLATYPWDVVKSKIFSQEQFEFSDNGCYFVKLTKRMTNGDVILAAHIKYDNYASEAAREIYSQIETQFNEGSNLAFVQVKPWFQGRAQIKLRGRWINNGKTFLALRIQGCSDPIGGDITRDRDNTNQVDETAIDDGLGSGWAGAASRSMTRYPELIDLTDTQEPDSGSETIELEEDEFEVIGTPRIVYDQKRGQIREKSGKPRPSGKLNTASTGEALGSGKEVGQASIQAPVVIGSHGVLRDMWNAMLHIKRTLPERVQKVEWFTFEQGFCSDSEPQLIALSPFGKDEIIDTDEPNWLYFDVNSKVPRGVLVARLSVDQRSIFILEIQRRPREGGNSEEPFRGLVFELEHEGQLESCLRTKLPLIRSFKGVVSKLEGRCPGKSKPFNHKTARDEQVAGESWLWNALNKIGIDR